MRDSSPIEAKSIRVAQASEGGSLASRITSRRSVEEEKKERGTDHWVPRVANEALKTRLYQEGMAIKVEFVPRYQRKESRHFHRNIEDTVTGDCSEEDEALMDCQSGPSTSNSGAGARAAL
ncbi:hypothetical protein TNCV_3781711 [Trichonephila clavipes]|nr:hypothetical protein TNCV_3781711 [Trichonephila clavipes]